MIYKKSLITSIRRKLGRIKYHLLLNCYWIKIPIKVKRLRGKKNIKVLFVVSEVASWKSELLYQIMLKHPRFCPLLGVSTSTIPSNVKPQLIRYINSRGYDYIDLDDKQDSIKCIKPDIIFYYKPYLECYSPGLFFKDNLDYLFCGMDYCFRVTKQTAHIEKELYDYCWQFYVENDEVEKRKKEVLGYRARNVRVTGVPMQDILLQPKTQFKDPWKDKSGKKRIIYAPHHSMKGTNGKGLEFSTFLSYGEAIQNMAIKYKDSITIAFKPHPNLYQKLIVIWGKEKTDCYYNTWLKLSNTQVETGDYLGLFKYSDAIIHDCASFIVEYLYMNKPAMFLMSETNNMDDMFDFVKQGLSCYEIGNCENDIENFVLRVISGEDKNQEIRNSYFENQLNSTGNFTACYNIIHSILEK